MHSKASSPLNSAVPFYSMWVRLPIQDVVVLVILVVLVVVVVLLCCRRECRSRIAEKGAGLRFFGLETHHEAPVLNGARHQSLIERWLDQISRSSTLHHSSSFPLSNSRPQGVDSSIVGATSVRRPTTTSRDLFIGINEPFLAFIQRVKFS